MIDRILEWKAERRVLEEQQRKIERRLAELNSILNAFEASNG